MPWIKRNLYFVITVVVGLGLAGFCGYLLYSALDQNKSDSEKYLADKSSLDSLKKKSPSPDAENIQAAELDAVRVRTFLDEFHKPFAEFPAQPTLDDQHFHEYLQSYILDLGKEATNAGVRFPAAYSFGFSQQINPLNYTPGLIPPWLQEMAETKTILRILFAAKINYLQEIKRPAVPGEEYNGSDYLMVTTVTNAAGVVTTPYMVSFRAFSAEIANVLAGVAASSNCLIVKTIHVEPSREPLPQLADLQAPAPTPAPMMAQQFFPPPQALPDNPFMAQGNPGSGFGRERRRMFTPQVQQYVPATPVPTVPTGPVAVLSETPLFVTIYIDVVKLKPKEPEAVPIAPSAQARPSRRAGP
jgi:hypothetical protein